MTFLVFSTCELCSQFIFSLKSIKCSLLLLCFISKEEEEKEGNDREDNEITEWLREEENGGEEREGIGEREGEWGK